MDGLRETIESAVVEHSAPAESAPAPVASDPVSSPSPASSDDSSSSVASSTGEQSNYAPSSTKTGDTPTIEEVVAKKTGESPDPVEHETEDARSRVDRAPGSWKGDAKAVWDQLPLNVRQEVIRREREMKSERMKINDLAPVKQRMDSLMEVLTPHRERINNIHGGNPLAAIDRMLNVEQVMFSGTPNQKAQLVANMIKEFRVDIPALDSLLSNQPLPQQNQQQSELERMLEQKLAPVQQFIQQQQQWEQRKVQQIEQEANHTVETMAEDSERFPYFNEVRDDMADLIELSAKKNIALSLEEAYSRAVRMNDTAYQASNVRESSQSATNAALQAHQAAQRAKGAAVSVSGVPSATGPNVGNPADLRGVIATAYGNSGERL